MYKKCLVCGAPLDGLFAKVASLAGVKPSEKNPDYCNKCESHIPEPPAAPVEKPAEPKDLYEAAAEPKKEEIPAEPVVVPEVPVTPAPTPAEPEIKLNAEEPQDMFAETDKKI